MSFAGNHTEGRAAARLSESDERAALDDELLFVKAFARCRMLSVRKAFESLARSHAGRTPGESALFALYMTSEFNGTTFTCGTCGRRHF
jgi:hypothetical protein